MILVSGATGKVGTALVAQLRAEGLPFRALAHTPASHERLQAQQIDAVLADNAQPTTLAAAFDGIERFFLLTPTSPDQAAIERGLVDAALRAGVRQIVKLSVLAAGDKSASLLGPHAEVERYIQQSGVGYTFLRPNLFMQNLQFIDAPLIKQQQAIYNSAGAGRVSFIDTDDIAAVAVAALRGNKRLGQTYELTGPETLSYGAVAEKLSALLGHTITYVPLDDEAYRGAMESAGVPGWYAAGLAELYRFYREGKGEVVTDTVAQITGRPARTIDAYLARERAAFE